MAGERNCLSPLSIYIRQGETLTADIDHHPELLPVDHQSPLGISEINDLTTGLFFNPEAEVLFGPFPTILGENQAARNQVYRAVRDHTFPSPEDLPRGQSSYFDLLDAVAFKEHHARLAISKMLEAGCTFGLAPWERKMLNTFCALGDTFDELAKNWFLDVVFSGNNEKAGRLGLTNPYTVVVPDRHGSYRQISLAEAYPELVGQIALKLSKLSRKLFREDNPQATSQAAYFRAFADALDATEIDKLPHLWQKANDAWQKTGGRLQVLAFFDRNADPNRIRLTPDFSLVINDPQVKDSAVFYRDYFRPRHAEQLDQLFDAYPLWSKVMDRMNSNRTYAQTRLAVSSGAFSSVPEWFIPAQANSEDAETGHKSFHFPELYRRAWKTSEALAMHIFRKDRGAFSYVHFNKSGYAPMLAGRELSEAVYSIREATGLDDDRKRLLAADLSDLAVTGVLPMIYQKDTLPNDNYLQLNHALFLLETYLFVLATEKHRDEWVTPQEFRSLKGLDRMVRSGFIRVNPSGRIRINPRGLNGFYAGALHDLRANIQVAMFGLPDLADLYIGQPEKLREGREISLLRTRAESARKKYLRAEEQITSALATGQPKLADILRKRLRFGKNP